MILIVDDNQEHIHTLNNILGSRNFRVDIAYSRSEAMEKLRGSVDALIIMHEQRQGTTDVPTHQFLLYCRNHDIPVIITTDASNETLSPTREHEVDYLSMPVDENVLLAKVKALYGLNRRKEAAAIIPVQQGQEKKFRYPGINSFETTDTDIFYGREDDRKKLADLVEIEKTVLVYSRSGLGKSSLLKAALMPELTLRGYRPYYIRLGLYQENSFSPVQNIIRRTVLQELKQVPNTFLQKFMNRTNSLWYVFKSVQVAQPEKDQPIALIFDQFEEISSYRIQHLEEFKQQLAELLYTPIPKDYLEDLKEEHLVRAPVTDAELDLLYKPLRIKAVFAIRSDQMSTLNALSDYLPNILKIYYALKPLSRKQAVRAIVEPAKQQGEFNTLAFTYKPEALEKVLEALVSEKSDDIDTAQLQILLQYIEQDVVAEKQVTLIGTRDLGDLNKVYENYYRNSLKKLTAERKQAQELIEDKLIVGRRRISYDMDLCLQTVSEATLKILVDTRLLRREPNTMGGYSYEISHDSLVAPILETREQRKRQEQEMERERLRHEEEERKKLEYEAQLKEQRNKQRRQRLIIAIVTTASIVSISLAVWAVIAQGQVRESLHEVQRQKIEVESQKVETQKALNDFIRAEIARKKVERAQWLREMKIYATSNDKDLERDARSQADTLELQIRDLEKRLRK